MKYFKHKNDVLAFEDDGSQDHLIPTDAVPISEADAMALLKAPTSLEDAKSTALARVEAGRQASLKGGFQVHQTSFASDLAARTHIFGLATGLQLQALTVASVPIATVEGRFVSVDVASLGSLLSALLAHLNAADEIARALTDAIHDATSIAEVEGIRWPA